MKGNLIKSLFGPKDQPPKCGGKDPTKSEVSFSSRVSFKIHRMRVLGLTAQHGIDCPPDIPFLPKRPRGPTTWNRHPVLTFSQLRQHLYQLDLCSFCDVADSAFFFPAKKHKFCPISFGYIKGVLYKNLPCESWCVAKLPPDGEATLLVTVGQLCQHQCPKVKLL